MNDLANTRTGGMTVLEDLAVQAQMFSTGAAMNLLQLGRVLSEAKPLVAHGDWAAWVKENAHMPIRTAQQYMQAYQEFGLDQRYAQLGPSKVIKLLPLHACAGSGGAVEGRGGDFTRRPYRRAGKGRPRNGRDG